MHPDTKIQCRQLHSELFGRRHYTLQSHGLFALAKHLLVFEIGYHPFFYSHFQGLLSDLDQYDGSVCCVVVKPMSRELSCIARLEVRICCNTSVVASGWAYCQIMHSDKRYLHSHSVQRASQRPVFIQHHLFRYGRIS